MREQPVVDFTERPTDPIVRRILDRLQGVLGRLVACADVALLLATGGYTATNAASGAGTALTFTRTAIDVADSGADQARVVVRGKNSAAGTVTVQVYDVTRAAVVCTVAVVDGTEGTFVGAWASLVAVGGDQEFEVQVVGDGVWDPVLYAVHLQLRTLRARS